MKTIKRLSFKSVNKKSVNKKPLNRQTVGLLLVGLALFSQVSQTDWPYLAKEYVVLVVLQLYLVTTLVVIPKLRAGKAKAREVEEP